MKKIIGIFICMLFLFSILPAIQGANPEKISEKPLQTENNSNYLINGLILGIVYGKIVYNGEELRDEPYGMCYNVTPINVRIIVISYIFGQEFNIQKDGIYVNPLYISQNMWHGFVGKHFLFLWGSSKTP